MFLSILKNFTISNDTFLLELNKDVLDTTMLQSMLESKKLDINFQNKDGNSFLNLSVINNNNEACVWLIQNGIDITLKNNKNENAIKLCIIKSNDYVFNYLVTSGKLDIDLIDENKRSLLQNVVISGQENMCSILIKHGASVHNLDNRGKSVLFDAVAYGNENMINAIVSLNDINLNAQDINDETVLHQMELENNIVLGKKLIELGADPTINNKEGKNFLTSVASKGIESMPIIDTAINQGYNLNNVVSNNNSTILMETLSVYYKLPENEKERRESLLLMANSLVQKGLDVNTLNEYGENALFDAVRKNDFQTCAFLINNKIDVNKKNRLNQMPLLLACYKGIDSLNIILLLLHNSADPTIKNELKQDLLEILNQLILHTHKHKTLKNNFIKMYLNEKGQYLTVIKEVLQNSQYKVNNLDSQNKPLFFTPLIYGHFDLFHVYINNKFDINSLDNNGANIFFLYIEFVFKINRHFASFKSNISNLVRLKADINHTNDAKKTIFSHVIKEGTNTQLYKDLLEACRFKYDAQDKYGRTIAHYAILNKNLAITQLIYAKNEDVLNVPDAFGILPLIYSALLTDTQTVKYILLKKNIHIKSNKTIPLAIKEKFSSKVENIDILKDMSNNGDIIDKDLLRKITILIDQIKSDFKIR